MLNIFFRIHIFCLLQTCYISLNSNHQKHLAFTFKIKLKLIFFLIFNLNQGFPTTCTIDTLWTDWECFKISKSKNISSCMSFRKKLYQTCQMTLLLSIHRKLSVPLGRWVVMCPNGFNRWLVPDGLLDTRYFWAVPGIHQNMHKQIAWQSHKLWLIPLPYIKFQTFKQRNITRLFILLVGEWMTFQVQLSPS